MRENLSDLLLDVAETLQLDNKHVNFEKHPERSDFQVLSISGVYDTRLSWSIVEYINSEMETFLPTEESSMQIMKPFIYRGKEKVAICIPVVSEIGAVSLCQEILGRKDDFDFCRQYPKVGHYIEQFGFTDACDKVQENSHEIPVTTMS